MILATSFTLIVEDNWKKNVFSLKIGLTTCYL